jgi:hypothetical protein
MELFKLLEPFVFNEGKESLAQKSKWPILCDKFTETPEELSSIEMFLMSKFVERAVQRNSAVGKSDEVKFLRNLQLEVKYRLTRIVTAESSEKISENV